MRSNESMTIIYNKQELKDRRRKLRSDDTKPEQILWQNVKNRNLKNSKFRRQFSFGYYIVDFYCKEKKLVIELDGDSHFTERGKEYDLQRDNYLKGLGLKILRITNDEIFSNLQNVLDKISEFL